MDKILMSGNEAIARGAWEAGAKIGVAYPGTPSTETLEIFARMDDVYAEWSTNEKVAVEVGLGASAAGSRVYRRVHRSEWRLRYSCCRRSWYVFLSE